MWDCADLLIEDFEEWGNNYDPYTWEYIGDGEEF